MTSGNTRWVFSTLCINTSATVSQASTWGRRDSHLVEKNPLLPELEEVGPLGALPRQLILPPRPTMDFLRSVTRSFFTFKKIYSNNRFQQFSTEKIRIEKRKYNTNKGKLKEIIFYCHIHCKIVNFFIHLSLTFNIQ